MGKKSMNLSELFEAQFAELAHLRAENERLQADGIHTCSDTCPRHTCVLRRENERLREALAELMATHDEDEGMDHHDDVDSVGWTAGVDGIQHEIPLTFGTLRRARAALSGESA